jgi:hypothetical protein
MEELSGIDDFAHCSFEFEEINVSNSSLGYGASESALQDLQELKRCDQALLAYAAQGEERKDLSAATASSFETTRLSSTNRAPSDISSSDQQEGGVNNGTLKGNRHGRDHDKDSIKMGEESHVKAIGDLVKSMRINGNSSDSDKERKDFSTVSSLFETRLSPRNKTEPPDISSSDQQEELESTLIGVINKGHHHGRGWNVLPRCLVGCFKRWAKYSFSCSIPRVRSKRKKWNG